jgi:hypothetical protein
LNALSRSRQAGLSAFGCRWIRESLVQNDPKLKLAIKVAEAALLADDDYGYVEGTRGFIEHNTNRPLYTPKMIVYMPSGSGKTTLAARYPWRYSDPDYVGKLLDHIDFDRMKNYSADFWADRNADIISIYRAYPPTQPIVLSWGPDTVPPEWRASAKEITIILPSTGIRGNEMNRASLIADTRIQDKMAILGPTSTEDINILIMSNMDLPAGANAMLKDVAALFPDFWQVCLKLGKNFPPTQNDYEILTSQQEAVDAAVRDQKITVAAYKFILDMAYSGQKPDCFYEVANAYDPTQLEDYNDLLAQPEPDTLIGYLHGLHVFSADVVLRSQNGLKTKRGQEYRTVAPAKLLEIASTEKGLYLRAPPEVSRYLIGHIPPRALKFNPDAKGLWLVDGSVNIPVERLVIPSFFALYNFYRQSGIPNRVAQRLAKFHSTHTTKGLSEARPFKVGMSAINGYRGEPRYRPYSRKTHQWKAKVAGSSAYPNSVRDSQTPRRARATEEAKINRAGDRGRLRRWQIKTSIQETLSQRLYHLEGSITARSTDQSAASIVNDLWPINDPDLAARTRIDSSLMVELFRLYYNIYGLAATHNLLWLSGGLGGQAIGGLTLYGLSSVRNNHLLQAILLDNWCCGGIKHYQTKTKAMHNVCRRTRKLPFSMTKLRSHDGTRLESLPYQTTDMLYLPTLVGRIQDTLLANDGFVEKRTPVPRPHHLVTRQTDPIVQAERWTKYADEVFENITSVSRTAIGQRSNLTPTEFHANFIQLAPPGSVSQLKDYAFKWLDQKKDVHKRILLDSLPTSFMWECLEEFTPEMYTNAQIKTETAAKLRQIIPGTDVHWLVESQVMFVVEKALYRMSPEFTLETSGMRVFSDMEERRLRTVLGNVTLASDYADFNFLHLIEEIKKWWLSIRAGARELAGPGDWNGNNYAGHVVLCCDWLISALDKMYVREVGGDGTYNRVKRGLWSGWRTTSIINNTFNYIYSKVIRADLTDILGYDPVVKYRLNGDDGDALMRGISVALLYLRHLNMAQLDIQSEKQLVTRVANEYLRIYASEGRLYGSVCRSIASFVSSDLQAPKIDKGLNYVKGTSAAISTLIRRGFDVDVGEQLRDIILPYYATIKTQNPAGDTVEARLSNLDALYLPEAQGGFGCKRYGQIKYYSCDNAEAWPVERPKFSKEGAPHYGVKAMMTVLQEQFHRSGLSTDVLAAVQDEAISITTSRFTGTEQTAISNYKRLLDIAHVEHMNGSIKIKTSLVPPGLCPEQLPTVVARTMGTFFNLPPDNLATYDFTPLDTAVARQLSRVLGLASITPNISKELRDATTGQRMTIKDIAERMGMALPSTYQLDSMYPTQLIEAFFSASFELDRDTFDTLPAELQPTLDIVHAATLRACWVQKDNVGQIMQQYYHIIKWTNHYFTQTYLNAYASRYQI